MEPNKEEMQETYSELSRFVRETLKEDMTTEQKLTILPAVMSALVNLDRNY